MKEPRSPRVILTPWDTPLLTHLLNDLHWATYDLMGWLCDRRWEQ